MLAFFDAASILPGSESQNNRLVLVGMDLKDHLLQSIPKSQKGKQAAKKSKK